MEDVAAPVVPVAYYRVDRGEGFSLPVVSLRDRRSNGQSPLIRWVFQKHLEIVLFGTYGQNSAVWKLLHQASLGRTTLHTPVSVVVGVVDVGVVVGVERCREIPTCP